MKIELTETEITHIMDALRERVNDLRESHSISGDAEEADLANELEELEFDLFEATSRTHPTNTNDLTGLTFLVGEDDFIDAGIEAREKMKQKLNDRLMKGTQTTVDLWSLDGLED